MLTIVRLNDLCSGHGCYPPRKSITCSPDILVEGDYVCRYGDKLAQHGCPTCTYHGGTHIGERTSYGNGFAIQVKGDPIDCGSVCEGSCVDTICGN